MEKYKKSLKIRLGLMAAYCLLLAVAILAGRLVGGAAYRGFIAEFAFGMGLGILVVLVVFIFKYNRALRDETALKALYIKEKDERNRYIREKMGGAAINWVLGGLAFGMLMAGYFFGQQTFFALLGAVLFTACVKGGMKLYYQNKY